MEEINNVTGLSPIQEKAAALLVGGKTITDIALELKIDRGTMYKWMVKINFSSYHNKLKAEAQSRVEDGLWSLHTAAIETLQTGLKSNNEQVKIKIVFWVIEKLEQKVIGGTDPRKVINKRCWNNNMDLSDLGYSFNESESTRLLTENNLME